jgi:hypothetical protein
LCRWGRSRCRSRSGNGDWGRGGLRCVELLHFPELLVEGFGSPDVCSKHERIGRETSAAETQPLVLGFPSNEGPTVGPGFKRWSVKEGIFYFFMTHQIGPESLHHLPDAPILQTLSNLCIVVVRSAPNLGGGDWRNGSVGSHGGGGSSLWLSL